MHHPLSRPRRLRQNKNFRRLIRESIVSIDNLMMPYFVVEGRGIKNRINSMPGIFQLSVDNLIKDVKEAQKQGIPAILLFGIPEKKDELGTSAYDNNGVIQKAIRCIKDKRIDILVVTDVCLCEYTSHGHCGVVRTHDARRTTHDASFVDNDSTLELLAKTAISHARAGADMVAPSSMMDGQVKAIREALDENNFKDVPIMAYSAKYASSFYSPFRGAAESTPSFGDRKTYQMDIANADEAVREVRLDIREGADLIMVKPGLGYQDIIYRIKEKFNIPVAVYNVSGEYSMIKAACKSGSLDERNIVLEIISGFKRAGASVIITYWAKDIAEWLRE